MRPCASADDIEYVRGLGTDQVIDYKKQNFEDILRDYDAVFDNVGGETYSRFVQGSEERRPYRFHGRAGSQRSCGTIWGPGVLGVHANDRRPPGGVDAT